ncbi:hypothetical protein M0J40_RS10100 [Providencia rettgeri]|nr:hypothetical protein [Providencia rettgeri]ELR5124520.1 hypothetical protein [Providencia rettgeri]ELR5245282.1 hypothetical protein [Providencia rettgeri]ELS4582711.1 hypothetical protein [Providencia rettgeri]
MQDLMPPINTPDSSFHDGDPTTGQLGTIVTALWLNNVQAATRDTQLELKNVLAKAGIQPDPKKTNQLAEAISQIIGSGNYASTAYVDNGLNKKIDKANISGQKGNDNDKVPSLNLFTSETGKLQPKGDYATNEGLNNGLALKVDKASIISIAKGGTGATNPIDAQKNLGIRKMPNYTNNSENGLFVPQEAYDFRKIASYDLVSQYPVGISGGLNDEKNAWIVSGNGYVCQLAVRGFTDNSAPNLSAVMAWTKEGIKYRINGVGTSNRESFGKVYSVYSTQNTTIDRNGYVRTSSSGDELLGIPIGGSIFWNVNTPIPENFWAHEGRSFSAITHPELAKLFPDLKMPDDRGYAIRVADNGRGIDAGRTVGTYQDDAVQEMTGEIKGIAQNQGDLGGTGVFTMTTDSQFRAATGSTAYPRRDLSFDISRVARVANETRMKNVAKILIMRVK